MQERPHTFYETKNGKKKYMSRMYWEKDISNSPAKKNKCQEWVARKYIVKHE